MAWRHSLGELYVGMDHIDVRGFSGFQYGVCQSMQAFLGTFVVRVCTRVPSANTNHLDRCICIHIIGTPPWT